jgi:hypothetical protein
VDTREEEASQPSLARLDASAGRRGAHPSGVQAPEGTSQRHSGGRRAQPTRAKPLVAGLLVAALAAGWLLVQRTSTNGGGRLAVAPTTPPSAADAPPPRPADTTALRALLADAGACADVVEAVPAVQCDIAGVHLEARLLAIADASRTYVSSSGARITSRQGPPACAQGRPDERAWSRPETPLAVAGRYRCRVEDGAAAIWWTDEHGVVAHAVAGDHDLGHLFVWWRGHRNG